MALSAAYAAAGLTDAAAFSFLALSEAREYRKVPKMAMEDPIQLRALTGFLKKRTLLTTTATRFMVLPTDSVTGLTPRWSSTM